MIILQYLVALLFPVLMIIAALKDATSYTIPNRLSAILVLGFLPAALIMGRPWGEIGLDFAVGAAALVAGMGMFAAGWIGGGDAKIFAMAGLWLGWPASIEFLGVTAVAGGGLAVLLLNARSSFVRAHLSGAPGWLNRLTTPGENVPYGVAIAVGALAAFPHCGLMQGLRLF